MNISQLYDLYLRCPNVTTDSRIAGKNSIFFALRGERFNGNLFARDALNAGCDFVVVDSWEGPQNDQVIRVENTLECLQELASLHRRKMGLKILAITGSNGKTTTKELIARVLGRSMVVSFTTGNLNNHIGVPLTLLKMNQGTTIGVVEMGANHIGEIARLCQIAKPDYGVITNIGKAHLEGFGSPEGVRQAKGELYDFLSESNGLVFLNRDRTDLQEMARQRKLRTYTYGTHDDCDCKGWFQNREKGLEIGYESAVSGGSGKIQSGLYGSYNFENALCATAVGLYFGVPDRDIIRSIEEYEPQNHRSQLIVSARNQIVMDAYNANPTSMRAAILEFLSLPGDNKVLILGDMFELGDFSREEHSGIVSILMDSGVVECYFVGREFRNVAGDHFRVFKDVNDLNKFLKKSEIQGKQILIKGSRGVHLEECLEYL